MHSPQSIARAAELACLLEASALKPGNVSPWRSFRDVTYEDFLASGAAIAPVLAQAGTLGIGEAMRLAVEATARATRSNTNLGIILLFVPIARAALAMTPGTAASLRDALRTVIDETTVVDAREMYRAIRAARPGGLGRVEEEDLGGEPTRTLKETMALADDRDAIAREFTTGYATTFEIALPALSRGRRAGLDWPQAIVECFLTVLAASPDTLIARKLGPDQAADISNRARIALAEGGLQSEAGRAAIQELDSFLGDPTNARNPGTTADLTAAAIFVLLLIAR